MNYYRIIALARDRDTGKVEETTFNLSVSWGEWRATWQREHGDRWRLIEVLSVEQLRPDEVLA